MLSPDFSTFPVLQTQRMILKQMNADDAPALFEMRSSKEVMQYINRPLAQSVNDIQALIGVITDAVTKNDGITWGLFLKGGESLIGTLGFWRIEKENYRAEIGYMLHPQMQGKGLMQEAVTKVLDYGFTSLKLHSVEANVNPLNAASTKLLKRMGFVQEGYFKENYYCDGEFSDSAIYSLLTPHKLLNSL